MSLMRQQQGMASAQLKLKTLNDNPYYNLGKLYTQLGRDKGFEYFEKAKVNYEIYRNLRPDDAKLIDDELYVLNAILESSFQQWPWEQKAKYLFAPFEGTWEGDGVKISISLSSICPEKYRFEYVECIIKSLDTP